MYSRRLISLALVFVITEAACPNKCSGHGSCGANDVCACDERWIGGDCSQRQCPFTRAWVDTAQHANDAHYYAECANRGTCNRKTGNCMCDVGFTGSGCRRMACPKKCNGHGTCEFIEEMAVDTEDKRIAGAAANTYADWDQEKIMGCKCDPGYEGHDCSRRMCPRGDDPLTGTTDQYDMKQYVIVAAATDSFYLTYYDQYGNAWTTDEISASGTLNDLTSQTAVCTGIQTALRRLPNHALDGVTVTVDTGTIYKYTRTSGANAVTSGVGTTAAEATVGTENANAWRCQVTFPSEPGATGLQHILGCQVGNHGTAGMQPLLSGTSGVSCYVAESVPATGTTTRKLTEIAECSNRGTCDFSTGVCKCFAGHKGTACETQEALV